MLFPGHNRKQSASFIKYATRNLLPAIGNSQGQSKVSSEQYTDNRKVTEIIYSFNINILIIVCRALLFISFY